MDLGNTIRKFRKRKRQTQSEFALACGITQTYLSQIESNNREPNLSTLKSISGELDVPLPIIFFLSLDRNDIAPHKRDAFDIINPSINSLVSEFFTV
jgi:transcriptional regulator with XRE-family HTH domain